MPAQGDDLPGVQGPLVDPQADVVGVELGPAVLPPVAAAALGVDDRANQRRRVGLRVPGLAGGDVGDRNPEGQLEVVALQQAAQSPALGVAAREGPDRRSVEVGPGQDRPRAESLDQAGSDPVGADHRALRRSGGEPAGLQHPVVVGELEEVRGPAAQPQGVTRQRPGGRRRRVGQGGEADDGRWLVLPRRRRMIPLAPRRRRLFGERWPGALDDLVPLDRRRVVGRGAGGGVGAPDQQIRPADPVTGSVDREQAGDDHLRPRGHRGETGSGPLLRWMLGQQPQVDHPPVAGGDQLLQYHGLEPTRPVEQLDQPPPTQPAGWARWGRRRCGS